VPIGFWSISRTEVAQIWEQLTHDTPSTPDYHTHINRIVRELPDRLEQTLQQVVKEEVEGLYRSRH